MCRQKNYILWLQLTPDFFSNPIKARITTCLRMAIWWAAECIIETSVYSTTEVETAVQVEREEQLWTTRTHTEQAQTRWTTRRTTVLAEIATAVAVALVAEWALISGTDSVFQITVRSKISYLSCWLSPISWNQFLGTRMVLELINFYTKLWQEQKSLRNKLKSTKTHLKNLKLFF